MPQPRRAGRRPAAPLTALLLLGATSPARAEENRIAVHVEAGPMFTVLQPEARNERRVASAGVHLQAALEISPNERVGLELVYAPELLRALLGGGAVLQQRIGAGLRVRPFYTSGYLLPRPVNDDPITGRRLISDVWIDLHATAAIAPTNSVAVDVGVGTRIPIVWPVQAGVYLRYQHLFPINNDVPGTFGQITAGVELSLGFLSAKNAPDGDRDGVPDATDRCPGTPRGARVNAVGCPIGRDTPPPRCSDSDVDGVCDGADVCPETPYGTAVDRQGCPADAAPEGGEPAPER